MKEIFSIVVAFLLCISLVACEDDYTTSDDSATNSKTKFSQQVTIVKMPSPPKCKTTGDFSTVNEVINVLSEINKTPKTCGNTNGWSIMIKLNVDGKEFTYTIASDTFSDSDGKQYGIGNFNEIEEKLTEIYNKINVPEVDYK